MFQETLKLNLRAKQTAQTANFYFMSATMRVIIVADVRDQISKKAHENMRAFSRCRIVASGHVSSQGNSRVRNF
jgi:hypothetical protein